MTAGTTRITLTALTIALACSVAGPTSRAADDCRDCDQGIAASGNAGGVDSTGALGVGCRPWEYGRPDLFYNFYVPNNCGGAPAAMYLAPRPVPEMVGHTYYTYQPLMPHEMLYPHHRTYRQWYDDGRGVTRTHASWYCGPLTATAKTVHQALRLAR